MLETEQTGAPGKSRRTRPVRRTSLVADTDVAVGRLLGRYLPLEGFQVKLAHTGQAVLDQIVGDRPDTIVIGSDLPDMTALELVRSLRSMPGPSCLVLLEATDGGVVEMLDAGADDCMRKPIIVAELAARLRKLIRQHLENQGVPAVIRTDELELDCVLWRIKRRGVEVVLSVKEHAALRMLVENVGSVVSNRDLLAQLWGSADLSSSGRTSSLIHNLRHKLGLTTESAVRVLSVSQVGYRLVVLVHRACA